MTIQSDFKAAVRPRKKDCHKGDCGRLLFLGGSRGLTGAACLAADAALRSGAGLVTLVVPESLNVIFETKLTEVMTLPVPDQGTGALLHDALAGIMDQVAPVMALAVGPGLGMHDSTVRLVRAFYAQNTKPCVLDADGLNAFVGNCELLKSGAGTYVVTPHPGEFDRLFGTAVAQYSDRRRDEAVRIAHEYGLTVVLKGSQTVVADPTGAVYVNTTGNPGMATAGSGDCLCGIITAFLGMGLSLFDAARFGVYVHGAAGDRAAREYGEYSMIASDIISFLPYAFVALQN